MSRVLQGEGEVGFIMHAHIQDQVKGPSEQQVQQTRGLSSK